MQFSHFSSSFDIEFSALVFQWKEKIWWNQNKIISLREETFVSKVCSQANSVMFCVLSEQLGKVFQRTALHVYVLLYCRNHSKVKNFIRIRCPNTMLVAVAFPFRKVRPAFWGMFSHLEESPPTGTLLRMEAAGSFPCMLKFSHTNGRKRWHCPICLDHTAFFHEGCWLHVNALKHVTG